MQYRHVDGGRSPSTAWLACAAAVLAWGCSSSGSDAPDESGRAPVLGNGSGEIFDDGSQGIVDGDTAFDSSEACIGQQASTELAPAILELLIDTSQSMNQNAPGSNRSKWVETREVLMEAVDLMPQTTSLGLVFYPDVGVNAPTCFDGEADVEVELLGNGGSPQRGRVAGAISRQQPGGSTPTHDAYRYALDQLSTVDAAGARFLVLITDGTPTYSLNCEGSGTPQDPADPTPLIPEAARALGRGMKTFVIGSPGSEDARASLSRMAQAGGTARAGCSHEGAPYYCHFDMTLEDDFAVALRNALSAISGAALSCAYDVPEPPDGSTLDPTRVNVIYEPNGGEREVIGRSPSGTCSSGWQYSDGQDQILLCGDACDRVREDSGLISLEFGCSTEVIF